MYYCMNNKMLTIVKLTKCDAKNRYDLKMIIPPKQRNIFLTSFKAFTLYIFSCICRSYYSTIQKKKLTPQPKTHPPLDITNFQSLATAMAEMLLREAL